jgi:hypothetical protein
MAFRVRTPSRSPIPPGAHVDFPPPWFVSCPNHTKQRLVAIQRDIAQARQELRTHRSPAPYYMSHWHMQRTTDKLDEAQRCLEEASKSLVIRKWG